MGKVLVTGATGFVGAYVIQELLNRGCEVIASSAHEEKARLAPWYHRVNFIALDLTALDNAENYFEYFSCPARMIHLAWEGLPNYKSQAHITEYLPRHQQLLLNMLHHGLQDLSVTGTCLEYGFREGCLEEGMPAEPSNPYAMAKDMLRIFLYACRDEYKFSLKWMRLFYMYGQGQHSGSLLSQLHNALARKLPAFDMSNGDQIRDFLPVETVARFIGSVALQTKIGGIINVCSNEPTSVKQFIKSYLTEKNLDIPLNYGHYPYPDYEPMFFWGDNTKLTNILKNERSN